MRALVLLQILLVLGLKLLDLVVPFSLQRSRATVALELWKSEFLTGETYVRELDIVSLINAELDPVQNQLVKG